MMAIPISTATMPNIDRYVSHGIEPHLQLQRLGRLALQASAHHELRDGDQEVDEERDGAGGVDQPREYLAGKK